MIYTEYLKTLDTCSFCDYTQEKFLENEHAYLTFSIAPYHPDHLLVVPKKHVEQILDLDKTVMDSVQELQRKGVEILKKLGHTNLSLLVKEGDVSEKSVAHIHFHIIPDVILETSDHLGAERRVVTQDEIDVLTTRIKQLAS